MITDSFMNVCFSAIFCKLPEDSNIRRDTSLYRDVIQILEFFEDKETVGIRLTSKTKLECLKRVCELKIEGKGNDAVIDSLTSFGKKFASLKDFLESKVSEELDAKEIIKNLDQIKLHKKALSMFSNYDELVRIVELIKVGNFEAIEDLVSNYEDNIKRLYINVMEHHRTADIEASASLDFIEDDHTPILQEIVNKYSRKNKVSAGFKVFNNEVLNGGFETERLYIFGGGTSAGKSTLLNNIIINSATEVDVFDRKPSSDKKSSALAAGKLQQ